MTNFNDPGKDEDDDQDHFQPNNGDANNFDYDLGLNGFGGTGSSSSDDEVDNEEQLQSDGYQLLPQDLPTDKIDEEAGFADFEKHFENQPSSRAFSEINTESSGNPSIQAMIQRSNEEHKREEAKERAEIYASTSSSQATSERDSICLDNSKIMAIKSSMSKISINVPPPEWLKEMSEEEWKAMLQQKLKK